MGLGWGEQDHPTLGLRGMQGSLVESRYCWSEGLGALMVSDGHEAPIGVHVYVWGIFL